MTIEITDETMKAARQALGADAQWISDRFLRAALDAAIPLIEQAVRAELGAGNADLMRQVGDKERELQKAYADANTVHAEQVARIRGLEAELAQARAGGGEEFEGALWNYVADAVHSREAHLADLRAILAHHLPAVRKWTLGDAETLLELLAETFTPAGVLHMLNECFPHRLSATQEPARAGGGELTLADAMAVRNAVIREIGKMETGAADAWLAGLRSALAHRLPATQEPAQVVAVTDEMVEAACVAGDFADRVGMRRALQAVVGNAFCARFEAVCDYERRVLDLESKLRQAQEVTAGVESLRKKYGTATDQLVSAWTVEEDLEALVPAKRRHVDCEVCAAPDAPATQEPAHESPSDHYCDVDQCRAPAEPCVHEQPAQEPAQPADVLTREERAFVNESRWVDEGNTRALSLLAIVDRLASEPVQPADVLTNTHVELKYAEQSLRDNDPAEALKSLGIVRGVVDRLASELAQEREALSALHVASRGVDAELVQLRERVREVVGEMRERVSVGLGVAHLVNALEAAISAGKVGRDG